uniref:Uncharacterized protein n=1 Tax=Panagrolaimus sp. JU765 TaxID=591449 RepID=A0AC34RC17_9BILA
MIETINGTTTVTRNGQKTNYNNDPFFGVVDEFDSGGLDDFDGTDYFGMLTDDRNGLIHDTDYNGLVRFFWHT